MIKHFKTRILVLATVLSCTVAGVAAAADVKPRLIRFGYGLNEESVQGRAARYLAQELEKVSGGKLKMRTFGSANLGSDEQMQGALVGGAQEMMVGSTAPLAGMVKEFGVFDLPFLFNSEKEADAVLDGQLGQDMLKKLEAKGLVGLVYWENGFRNMTNSKRPITARRRPSGHQAARHAKPDRAGRLQHPGRQRRPDAVLRTLSPRWKPRTVDGQENPITTIQSSKFYEVQPYLTITRHVYTPWVVMASKKWWDTLSPEEQKLIRQAAVASRDFERQGQPRRFHEGHGHA